MNSYLTETGYILDVTTGVWSRQDYTGIAYSDGDEVEQRIASIINEASDLSVLSSELRQHCTDWPSLYHLSGSRANILRPFESNLRGNVLEIGAGCGAITRYLGECGGNVLALEGSPRRAAIARARTRDLQNVTVVSDRFDLFSADQKFDAITLIGVLEYANLFTPGEKPALNMLERIRALLKPEGKLFIAIENQLGLKYFAGAPEDHLGQPMYGIEGRYCNNQPQTFGRIILAEMLKEAGFSACDFLAPFPDYKLPVSVITERGFKTEKFDAAAFAWQSVRRDPQLPSILAFSPELVWPTLAQNDLALDLANSFLIVASSSKEPNLESSALAWHFTTERKKEFCKKAVFLQTEEKKIRVSYQLLAQRNNKVSSNTLLKFDLPNEAEAEYIFGTPLSQELITIVTRDGWCIEEVVAFMKRYLNIVASFVDMQGDSINILSPDTLLPGYLFDAIPQNIIITSAGSWRLIDKEWEATESVRVGFLCFRSLITLFHNVTKFGHSADEFGKTYINLIQAVMNGLDWLSDKGMIISYANLEAAIQTEVSGRTVTMDWLGNPISRLNNLNQAVTERDEQIASLNQAIAEHDGRLAQLAREIGAREAQLTKQLEAIRLALAQKDVDRQTELEIIYRSTSWRLTWPVRLVGAKFRKVRRGLVAYRHARTNYSLKEIVLRTYAIYRNDGLSGLIKRAKLQATIADYMASSSRARSRSAQQLDRDLSTALLAPARDAINSIDLSDHDILSLDIFDTAILRLVSQPTDVFRHIEEQIPNPGFCNWRVQRERDERERRHPAREISISQIYEEDSLRIDMEFKIEQATCVANPEIYELYRRALRQGKSVIFVSDMYLNRAQIELLLDQTGYTKRDQVYVSADDQLLKGDGSRFQALRAQYEGKSLLHIGDNRVSDVDRALGAGFAAIHYQLPDSFYQNDRLLSGMYPTLKDNKSLSVSTLLASYQYWKLGISRTSQISIWREVGFLFAGPLLFGFIRHLKAYLDEHKGKVGNVYFIARDGDIMKQVFDYLYANSDYRVCYLTLSRRSVTFPLFAMKSSAAIDRILSVYTHCEGNMSVDNLMRRLGYDEVGEMRDFLQTVAKKNGGFIAKSDIMDAFRRYRDDLAALARVEGEALQRYLDEIGFHDGAPLLVDVGWNGTIQDCLGILCEDGSSTSHIYGMYLGVWENVQNIDRKHGYLFQGDALNGRFGTYIDFIEFLTSSPKLGVKCLKLGAAKSIQPEYFDTPDEEKARNDAAREIQRGVMEYCALVKDREILQNHIPSPDNIFDLFSVLKANQSPVVLAAFNTLRHQQIPNGEYLHPIFNFNV